MTLFVIITMQIPSAAGYKVGYRIPPEFRDGSVLYFSAEPDQYNPGT